MRIRAAIDALDKGTWGVEWDKALAKAMIESLPSAQPERPVEKVQATQTVVDMSAFSTEEIKAMLDEEV